MVERLEKKCLALFRRKMIVKSETHSIKRHNNMQTRRKPDLKTGFLVNYDMIISLTSLNMNQVPTQLHQCIMISIIQG